MTTIACSSLLYDAPLADALRAVRGLGFRHVDLGVLEGWAHVDPSALARDYDATASEVREQIARHDVEVVALNAGLGDEDRGARASATLRLAADLGADSVTFGAPPQDATIDEAVAWAAPIVTAARDHPTIASCLEFHTLTFTEVVADCVTLVEATGLGLTFDVSHYYIGPAQGHGIEDLLPHVRHVHVRDCGRSIEQDQLPWGAGAVDLPAIVDDLLHGGYRGRFSVEYIGVPDFPGDMEQSVLDAAAALRFLLAGDIARPGA